MSCGSQWSQVALLISILGGVVTAPWQGEQCGAVTRWASWRVTEHTGFQGVQLELKIFSIIKDLAFQILFTVTGQNNKKNQGVSCLYIDVSHVQALYELTMVI